MRSLAIGGLWLYGAANILAGVADLAIQQVLPLAVALALIAVGALLVLSGVLTLRGSQHAVAHSAAALSLALLLAVFNERVLGLGHPSHHIVRGLVTVAIMWLVWRVSARPRQSISHRG